MQNIKKPFLMKWKITSKKPLSDRCYWSHLDLRSLIKDQYLTISITLLQLLAKQSLAKPFWLRISRNHKKKVHSRFSKVVTYQKLQLPNFWRNMNKLKVLIIQILSKCTDLDKRDLSKSQKPNNNKHHLFLQEWNIFKEEIFKILLTISAVGYQKERQCSFLIRSSFLWCIFRNRIITNQIFLCWISFWPKN